MNSNIMIKSYRGGLKIFLDSNCSFAELCDELKAKFTESAGFFGDSKLSVSFEGRALNTNEEKTLIAIMENASGIHVLYVIGIDEQTHDSYAKAINSKITGDSYNDFGKIYPGSLKKGDFIKADNSIVIAGDVEPGSMLTAKGSVIILGGLYGGVNIEVENSVTEKCFVYANDFLPDKLCIGDYSYFSKEKSKWVVRPKMVPKMAYVRNSQVTVEPVSNLLFSKLLDGLN